MSSSPEPIPIRVSHERAFVLEPDHVATLRTAHRITGVLTGTLPHLSQQNVFLGLPLLLAPEEVVLLLSLGLGTLIDDPRAHRPPSPSELADWDAQRISGALAQLRRADGRKAEGRRARENSEQAVAKRAAREEKRRAAARARAEHAGEPYAPEPEPEPAPAPPQDDAAAVLASKEPWAVSVPGPSGALPWYAPARATYSTLESARAAGVWSFPRTRADEARCAVFADLWDRGHWMGPGSKFGGDWLVYPGDPLRYHSHFVATAHRADAPLRPMEIVAHGRLGTATKKAHLLCSWDAATGAVRYTSIEWAGFG